MIPKNDYGPVFYGYIFINEDLWNIHSLELGVTAKASQVPILDSLTFRQIFIPIDAERWMPLSNLIRFKMNIMGFKLGGNFACVYSNYILDETDDEVFNREVFKVEKEANTRTEKYWDSLRPIPLTIEEKLDYNRKDSIRIVKESPEYLDSIDKERNKLKWTSLLTGHSFQNSIKRSRISYKSPLNLEVNTIQGWVFNPNISYAKAYDENWHKNVKVTVGLNYGLSEKVWRPQLELFYQANRTNNTSIRIRAGRELTQYNRIKPISTFLNSLFTQAFGRNYLKAYDRKFIDVRAQRYLGDLFFGRVGLEYADRSAVVNNYLNSFRNEDDQAFTSNDPQFPDNESPAFDDHQALIFRAGLLIRLGAEVWSYPDRKFRSGSDWPSIWIFYKRAIPINGLSPDFDLLYTTISKSFSIGTLGDAFVYTSAGKFLRKENVPFIDHYHFLGNQTNVRDPFLYRNSYLLLPYYTHSTDDSFLDLHFEHNFNGFLISKIPGIRALGWHLVGGAKYLDSSSQPTYTEFYFGIDNIGFSVIRPLRIDFVWASHNCDQDGQCNKGSTFGVVLGVKTDF